MSLPEITRRDTGALGLWQKLTDALSGVMDTHFVCAIVAAETAAYLQLPALVALHHAQEQDYDIWIAQPHGALVQERWKNDKGAFGAIVSSPDAVRLEKLSRPANEVIGSELWLRAQESVLALPLALYSDPGVASPSGVLAFLDPPQSFPLPLDDLELLARSLSIYLDRAALRRQLDQQEVEFGVVSDLSHLLTSTLSMERVFGELTGTIRRILQVESLSVGLKEENSGDVVFVESLMGARFANLPVIRLKPGQGIAGWVAENGEAVVVNDVYADRRFYPGADRQSGFRTRSMICIPLQIEEQTIGVLQAINRRDGRFTERDLRLLEALGGPLAAAIENSRLHTDVLSEKRRMETILAGMSDGLLVLSPDGEIARVNDAFQALVLAELPDLLEHNIDKAVTLRDRTLSHLVEEVVRAEDDSVQVATELLRTNGEWLPVLISGAPIPDEKGHTREIILTFSDLSQIREVERMRDDLFHAIAHELRTPLATILMYARLLLEGKAQDEEKAERFLGVIERESDRLQLMVRRMMQLAKQEARDFRRNPEPVFLNPLLEAVLPPLADQARQKGLLFRRDVEDDLPPILADEERVEEIVHNLVGNAIKFSPAGTIRFEACREDEQILLTIGDEGIGISQQALPYLFNRFYRAQSAVDRGIAGTGLGLYMVKQSVEQYGGSISVNSAEDEGTTFKIRFPIHAA